MCELRDCDSQVVADAAEPLIHVLCACSSATPEALSDGGSSGPDTGVQVTVAYMLRPYARLTSFYTAQTLSTHISVRV